RSACLISSSMMVSCSCGSLPAMARSRRSVKKTGLGIGPSLVYFVAITPSIRDALAPDFLTLEPGQGDRRHISVRHVLDAQRGASDLKHLDDVFRAVPAEIAQDAFVIEVIGCHHRLLPKRRVALVLHNPFFHDCGSFWRARRAISSTASLRMPYSSKVMNSACSSTRTNALRARRIMS